MLQSVDIFKPCKDKNHFIEQIQKSSLIDVYIAALECQVKFCARATRESLPHFQLWKNATSVLDAGCGPAAFANEVKDLLSNKQYLGIDVEQSFIHAAKKEELDPLKFKFENQDI